MLYLFSDGIEKAAAIIKKGGIIAYPTETFYGLGVNALDEKAVNKLFIVKKRPTSKPISILISDLNWLQKLVKRVPPVAEELISQYWPGPLTIVFEAAESVLKNLTAGTGKIAIRISSHPLAQRLVQLTSTPITATSANLFQMPPPISPEEIDEEIKRHIDAILNGGKTSGGMPSTIIDVTIQPPVILRKGAVTLAWPEKK
ncbi:MAG: threonylcarbamoyl-AMP synthase [Candidatus Desulfofervidaceae bacterium]|nr:threonylcarbamoyl-AMP synthase [Candidatus Desulfofervidaceae bacterium]MDL1971075.1 threonylcarbamoyl-AMP synthase [Candidatus Desulfofervidaceae bacterium]